MSFSAVSFSIFSHPFLTTLQRMSLVVQRWDVRFAEEAQHPGEPGEVKNQVCPFLSACSSSAAWFYCYGSTACSCPWNHLSPFRAGEFSIEIVHLGYKVRVAPPCISGCYLCMLSSSRLLPPPACFFLPPAATQIKFLSAPPVPTWFWTDFLAHPCTIGDAHKIT